MQFYPERENDYRVMRTSKFRVETIPLPTMELQTDSVVQLHALTESFKNPASDEHVSLKTFVNGGPWAIFAAFEPVRQEGLFIAYLVPGKKKKKKKKKTLLSKHSIKLYHNHNKKEFALDWPFFSRTQFPLS